MFRRAGQMVEACLESIIDGAYEQTPLKPHIVPISQYNIVSSTGNNVTAFYE